MIKKKLAIALFAIAAAPAFAQVGPYERELDAKIYDAIGAGDYRRAQDLAVTPRQRALVEDSKKRSDPLAGVRGMSQNEQWQRNKEQRILIREGRAAAAQDYLNNR